MISLPLLFFLSLSLCGAQLTQHIVLNIYGYSMAGIGCCASGLHLGQLAMLLLQLRAAALSHRQQRRPTSPQQRHNLSLPPPSVYYMVQAENQRLAPLL